MTISSTCSLSFPYDVAPGRSGVQYWGASKPRKLWVLTANAGLVEQVRAGGEELARVTDALVDRKRLHRIEAAAHAAQLHDRVEVAVVVVAKSDFGKSSLNSSSVLKP